MKSCMECEKTSCRGCKRKPEYMVEYIDECDFLEQETYMQSVEWYRMEGLPYYDYAYYEDWLCEHPNGSTDDERFVV